MFFSLGSDPVVNYIASRHKIHACSAIDYNACTSSVNDILCSKDCFCRSSLYVV